MLVFTDVHGNFNTFLQLYDKIPQEEKDSGVVIAGDLVDRGPRSMEMVQWCIDNPEVMVVRGNHEQMMIEVGMKNAEYFFQNLDYYPGDHYDTECGGYGEIPRKVNLWGANGGFEALDSYIKESIIDLDMFKKHVEWMKELPLYLEFKDVKNEKGQYLLVTHSSASRVWKWDEKRRSDQKNHFIEHLLWGRPRDIKPIENVFNIFGHTPMKDGPRITEHYANIDTGCFSIKRKYGKLTAISFPSMKIYEQRNIDGFYKPIG